MLALESNYPADRRASHGFIGVAVLWILGALAALVSIYGAFVINTASGFAAHEDHLRANAAVSAALELTAHRQFAVPTTARRTHGQFGFRLERVDVAVEYRSEAARIDINIAPKELLIGLFVSLGERPEDALRYANRIVEWRTAPKGQESQVSEASVRSPAGFTYTPRGAKFPHISELLLVRDMPPTVAERALPYLTVYSNRANVNIFEASRQVIAALPGMTSDRVRAVLLQRQAFPDDGKALLTMLGAAQQHATIESSKALRVSVRVAFATGRQMSSEVVILLFDNGKEPYSILSWRDALDEPHAR